MPINWEQEYRAAFEKNIADVMSTVREGRIDTKIRNFCDLHGFTYDEVVSEIENNKIVAACFAIDPTKQNIYEKLAAACINNIPRVENFEMLPTNFLYVVDGELRQKNELAGRYPKSKTIDFSWEYRGAQLYASHKYTKQVGGAQGNQYKDLQRFISDVNSVNMPNTYFIAIADGEFYDKQNGVAHSTRLEKLKSDANKQTVFACTIAELEELLINITSDSSNAI